MSIDLKPYQEKAVEKLIAKTIELLGYDGPGEVCVFQAPTGSGKTVMMAKFIEGIIKELPQEDFCFIWMSIGKGELHLQSKHSLQKIFGGFPRVVSLEEEFTGSRERIVQNEVVVANWEKLRTKDRTSGEWKNIVMKDGEKLNFREVLEKTREQRKIILVIDESHVSADTARANELRDLIGADVVLEMSATPHRPQQELGFIQELARGGAGYIMVEPKDVIDEGMIKKELIINEDIGKIAESEEDSQTAVLEAAYRKRVELKKSFEKEGSDVNPLVLIQIPTAAAGEQKIDAVRKFLSGKDITERKGKIGNGKLAVWLAEEKSELIDWVSEPDNEIEFLVFKQAIDTGWDCPRAHILVKFRETHSIPFEIQIVGRILRMPEQRHYENEILNRGYIYTNLKSIEVKKEEYNPNIIKHLRAERVSDYKPIKLKSYYKARADYGDVTSSFNPVFSEVANEYFGLKKDAQENIKIIEKMGVDLSVKKYQQEIIADTHVNTETFDGMDGSLSADAMAKLSVAAGELQLFFEQTIKNNLGSFKNVKRSVPAVKAAIYLWFRKAIGTKEWDDEMFLVQKIFQHDKNRGIFEHILSQAIDRYKVVKDQEVRERIEQSEQWYDFELKPEQFYNEHADEQTSAKNYAYEPCYLNIDRSQPERSFEVFLGRNSTKIDWWWKNGENKLDYYGIKYEYQGSIYTFYPDYLVKLKDGQLGIFEVKETNDRDGTTYTKAKAEAFQKHLVKEKNKKLFGGIVIERTKAWMINDNSGYNWEKCEKDDWSDWKILNF